MYGNPTQHPSRLSYALLVYMIMIVFLITLIPFQFEFPKKFSVTIAGPLYDIVTNILFFVPIGFLLRLSQTPGRDSGCILALILGIAVSATVETCQLFIPGRYSTITDVVTNGLGAWMGGLIASSIRKRINAADTHLVFALELPLMTLVYLTVPLMWLNSLATGHEGGRVWLLLLLGIFGSGVIASVYANRLKKDEGLKPAGLPMFVTGWFLFASIPAMVYFPLRVLLFGLVIAAFAQIGARLSRGTPDNERRFELPTLKKLLPIYAVYLILVYVWPTTIPLNAWGLSVDFKHLRFYERDIFIFRFVEVIAAFTLFGYIIAEMLGRKRNSSFKAFFIVLLTTLSGSAGIQILRGNSLIAAVNLMEPALITFAALFGAAIYQQQLSTIRR